MNFLSPQFTLIIGVLLSFTLKNSPLVQTRAKNWSGKILQFSVILLGASLNFHSVINQGAKGVLITFTSILLIFAFGFLGFKLLKIEEKLGTLITMGTAICGGSAIGALAPVIEADSIALTISIGIVFLLNALSIFIFPPLGEWLNLTQDQFGLWSALAIHDTSSVVAASSLYGEEALKLATMIKLTRALWIIPITLFFSFYVSKNKQKKIAIPWFILGFLILSLLFTFIDQLQPLKEYFVFVSKTGFAMTLFLIGLTFNWQKMQQVGFKPLLFGVGLWIMTASFSLLYIYSQH